VSRRFLIESARLTGALAIGRERFEIWTHYLPGPAIARCLGNRAWCCLALIEGRSQAFDRHGAVDKLCVAEGIRERLGNRIDWNLHTGDRVILDALMEIFLAQPDDIHRRIGGGWRPVGQTDRD